MRTRPLILIYGRPSQVRNGFDIISEALKVWAATYPTAGEWTLVSVGERHRDIQLGHDVVLRSRGKLNLEEYADFLTRCWIRISFVLLAASRLYGPRDGGVRCLGHHQHPSRTSGRHNWLAILSMLKR